MFDSSSHLKRRFAASLGALLLALFAAAAATFAWYVYNTGAHTTRVKMAAGTSVSLYIANTPEALAEHRTSADLETFTGSLNPVSTNRIQRGFQKVLGFTNGTENQPTLVANLFGSSESSDYYKTSLYLATDGASLPVYLYNIDFSDSDADNPISTAIRVGFVVPATGEEYIFAINAAHNPRAEYNTQQGVPGHVLDSTQTDGSTLPFAPYTSDNFCAYTPQGGASLLPASKQLCTATGAPLQVDVYIWLEGCDEDCTQNLSATTLRELALGFCGYNG